MSCCVVWRCVAPLHIYAGLNVASTDESCSNELFIPKGKLSFLTLNALAIFTSLRVCVLMLSSECMSWAPRRDVAPSHLGRSAVPRSGVTSFSPSKKAVLTKWCKCWRMGRSFATAVHTASLLLGAYKLVAIFISRNNKEFSLMLLCCQSV